LLLHCKNGFANAPQCYVYVYVACLITASECVYCAVRTEALNI